MTTLQAGPRRFLPPPPALLIGAALVGLIGCADPEQARPTEPAAPSASRGGEPGAGRGGPIERFPELVEHVPEVRLGDPGGPRWADVEDAALVDAVRAADGVVMIGFKPVGARRTHETGVVPGISRAEALAGRAVIQARGAEITMTLRHSSMVVATIPAEVAPALRRLPAVDYVEPSFPGMVQQASTQDTSWGVKKVRAHLVWDQIGAQSTRGEAGNVTIIDTGLDAMHLSPTGDGPANVNPNCYWTQTATISSCYDVLTSNDRGHGAAMLGIIAARNNAFGVIGAAHNPAMTTSIRACDNFGCAPGNVIAALQQALALTLPRHVVNVSIGYCYNYTAMQQAVAQLHAAGVLVVAAAGNVVPNRPFNETCNAAHPNLLPDWATSVMWPARYPEVVGVSGTLEQDQFAAAYAPAPGGPDGTPPDPGQCDGGQCAQSVSCTNGGGSRSGPEVDIAAPFKATTMASNGGYAERCGTSYSAALVSGVAALVWSRNPNWTATQVRQRLKSSAIPYAPMVQFASGRVDAYNAVFTPRVTYVASVSGPTAARPGATCSFSASSSSPYSPHSFSWSVNGSPLGYGGAQIYHTAGSGSFTLSVVVHDALGGQTRAFHDVTVSTGAPECHEF